MTDPECENLQEVRDDKRDHIMEAHNLVEAAKAKERRNKIDLETATAKRLQGESEKIRSEKGTV